MKIVKTEIPGLLIIEPLIHSDNRGYFQETYNKRNFENVGITNNFVQENISQSSYGVVRGLHFQKPPYSQAKLCRVISGKVYDVAVDLRKDSPSFGKWFGLELSSTNKLQFFIPRGFAHGLSVLEDNTIFCYKCDNYYNPESEDGILFSDPQLNIDWKLPAIDITISPKDLVRPMLKDIESVFC